MTDSPQIPDNYTEIETESVGLGECKRVYLTEIEGGVPPLMTWRKSTGWHEVTPAERPRVGFHDGRPVLELPWTWSADSVRVFRVEDTDE